VANILTIDIGNSAVKAVLYSGESRLCSVVTKSLAAGPVFSLLGMFRVEGIAVCSVRDDDGVIFDALAGAGCPVVKLGQDTPLPITVDYDRSTVGADRLAAACGVAAEGSASLIVDAGTAVTADLVSGLRFAGGNISPGLSLRFRALSHFTSKLPLVSSDGELPMFGHDTDTAIRAGVMRGLAAEILADFNGARALYNDLSLILTGGDAALLAKLLTEYGLNPVIDYDAVGRGLVRIFNYNV